ncbi:Phosphatidylglycerol lysyltransferase [Gimesia alba]|uniref:Phosphatidylglycerol lysyltransferase n=1 Tax=Gimesia alba TaxID=2527973 RepID=A0A517RCB9_9PLAN|nr:Phosphatidylglycerol lysyltransferase [Gimesia alba]
MISTLSPPKGTNYFASYDSMRPERIAKLESLAFKYGEYHDSYLVTEPNRHYFWGKEDCGVIGFCRDGRYLHIVGGLIAAKADQHKLLENFIEFARLNQLVISFFGISEVELPTFREQGFRITKYGEEARLNLADHHWSGKPFEWVRRQENYVRRQNVVLKELHEADHAPDEWQTILTELLTISEEHICNKSQTGEIPFFEGQLIPGYLHRRRLFVAQAEAGRGRFEGFLLCTPLAGGNSWSFEMYRQRNDAVRGTIPFLMKQAIDVLAEEGCKSVSLCPIPTLRCKARIPDDCFVSWLGLRIWGNCLGAIFDTKGMYHFKSRFRPQFENIYICSYPTSSLGTLLSFVRCVKALNFKVSHVFKKLLTWNPQRLTLAHPTQASLDYSQSAAAGSVDMRGNLKARLGNNREKQQDIASRAESEMPLL